VKKILINVLFLFGTISCFGQLIIEKPAKGKPEMVSVGKGNRWELFHMYKPGDTSQYCINYTNDFATDNIEEKSRKIFFKNEGNVLNNLYLAMKSVFSDKNKRNKPYSLKFILGETHIKVERVENETVTGLLSAYNGDEVGFLTYTKKDLEKVFKFLHPKK
jgi:hypothetical protein